MAIIEFEHVGKRFTLQDSLVTALQDVTFAVGEREFVSLIGPSGCGKSTLLRLVAGLLQPTQGEIRIHGLSPAEARRRRLYAFVFQDPIMFAWRTVLANVELPLELCDAATRKANAGRAEAMLDLVGLHGFEKASPSQLSGGMKHRAAIARALLLEPPVLLMDEPFGALDEITRDRMNLELLRIWAKTDAAVLFVTHSIEEAVFLSDRVVVLSPRPGTVVADLPINLPRPRLPALKQSEEAFSRCTLLRKKLAEITAIASLEAGAEATGGRPS